MFSFIYPNFSTKLKYPSQIQELSNLSSVILCSSTTSAVNMVSLKTTTFELDARKHDLSLSSREVRDNLAKLNSLISKTSTNPTENKVPSSYERSRIQELQRDKGLYSSFSLPDKLRECWYPVEFSSQLTTQNHISIELFGETWALWRDQKGMPLCCMIDDAYQSTVFESGKEKHQSAPLHHQNGNRQFGARTSTFRVFEMDGLLWLWPGRRNQSFPVPLNVTRPPQNFSIHSELVLEVPIEHGLLLENLLDLAHAPFTHTQTFANGWPIPDVVKFHSSRMLGGNWEPYPIDMSFEPPCMVVSTIGLAQPGKIERGVQSQDCNRHLHQLHVCLPSSRGNCRLLYRMSLDFMSWCKYIPGIGNIWASVANQVLGEDLRLVAGQQERMRAGTAVWANPVSYDKLGVRYRRWRNSAQASVQGSRMEHRSTKKMSSSEIFSIEL